MCQVYLKKAEKKKGNRSTLRLVMFRRITVMFSPTCVSVDQCFWNRSLGAIYFDHERDSIMERIIRKLAVTVFLLGLKKCNQPVH